MSPRFVYILPILLTLHIISPLSPPFSSAFSLSWKSPLAINQSVFVNCNHSTSSQCTAGVFHSRIQQYHVEHDQNTLCKILKKLILNEGKIIYWIKDSSSIATVGETGYPHVGSSNWTLIWFFLKYCNYVRPKNHWKILKQNTSEYSYRQNFPT